MSRQVMIFLQIHHHWKSLTEYMSRHIMIFLQNNKEVQIHHYCKTWGTCGRPKLEPWNIPTFLFIKVAPNSIFGVSWLLGTLNMIFQGLVFNVKKWGREKFWREENCLIVFKVAQIEGTFKEPWRWFDHSPSSSLSVREFLAAFILSSGFKKAFITR